MREKWQKEPFRVVACPDPECPKKTGGNGRNDVRHNLASHFRVVHGMDRERANRVARAAVPTADKENA